jgi:hypothetical protein
LARTVPVLVTTPPAELVGYFPDSGAEARSSTRFAALLEHEGTRAVGATVVVGGAAPGLGHRATMGPWPGAIGGAECDTNGRDGFWM